MKQEAPTYRSRSSSQLTKEEREKLTKALLNPDKNWIEGLNNQLKEIRKHMKIVKKTDKCVSVEFDDLDLSFLDKKRR